MNGEFSDYHGEVKQRVCKNSISRTLNLNKEQFSSSDVCIFTCSF